MREVVLVRPDLVPSGATGKAPMAGYINRLPHNSGTAATAAHVRDLRIDARRERDEMRHALDSIGIGVWDWDIPSLEVWYSSHAHELLGYNRQDAAQMVNIFRQLIHPEDEAHTEAAQNAILYGTANDYRAEFRVRHKEGHWVWVEAVGRAVVRAADGTALRIAGTFIGIDARKQEQADAAFLVDLANDLLKERDADALKRIVIRKLGTYLQADRVGYGRLSTQTSHFVIDSEWLGSDIPSLMGAWTSSACSSVIEYVRATCRTLLVRDIGQVTAIDDQTRGMFEAAATVSFVVVPLVIEGDVHAALILMQSQPRTWQPHEIALAEAVASRLWDAALRARAEERSRADKALLELALRMTKLGAREMNRDTGQITTSENFYSVIGHPDATDLTVDEYLSHVHPEDRDRLISGALRAQSKRGDGIIANEHRIITADEQIRYISLLAQHNMPDGKAGDRQAYSAIIVQDVTEQRKRALEVDRANDRLLKQSRLSAMGIMASTLAHELSQPLATAVNYLSLVESIIAGQKTLPHELSIYVAHALSKVLAAGQLIRRIRSFTADGEIEATPQKLRDLVFRALSARFGQAGAQDIKIVNTVSKSLIVQVDALLAEHAISNIVGNAVDALKGRPGAAIHISAARCDTMIDLYIADNGPGLDAAVATSVFDPFVTTKPEGTGLGLAICRTMVEANGGRLILKEHGPDGTVFCIGLPSADHGRMTGKDA